MKRLIKVTMFFLFFMLLVRAGFCAGKVSVTTYFAAPYGDYVDFSASDALTVGSAAAPATSVSLYANSTKHVLDVKNNLYDGWDLTHTHGGNLRVDKYVDIQNASTTSLFYVDPVNNRVGIGTTSPRNGARLDVLGDVKSMIVAAHQDTVNYGAPWAEMNAQANTSDSTTTAANVGQQSRFAAVYNNGSANVFCTLHLDAKPLYFQSLVKSGVTAAQGHGQVVIRGYFNPAQVAASPPNQLATDLIFVVGETPSVYSGLGWLPDCRANGWNAFSSREFKKDITPLSPVDYQNILSKLASTDIVQYHYRIESSANKIHTGFIAEDAPSDIVSADRKGLSQQDEIGFLLASLKALKMENQELREMVEKLKK